MSSILITGANRGLGLEFAKQYLADGWQVIAACRNPSAAQALRRLEDNSGGSLTVIAMDVADAASVQRAAADVQLPSIDILINSAGIFGGGRQTLSDEVRGAPRVSMPRGSESTVVTVAVRDCSGPDGSCPGRPGGVDRARRQLSY